MKSIELSRLSLSKAAMLGALVLGTMSTNTYAARPTQPAPAKEAIEACQGKKEGDIVQLSLTNGKTAKAVCRKDGGKLVARRSAAIGPL